MEAIIRTAIKYKIIYIYIYIYILILHSGMDNISQMINQL